MCRPSLALRTFAELRASGQSRRNIDSGTRAGTVTIVRRGIYATADACLPAIRAAQHGGPLACVAAARHLGIWVLDEDETVHVWLGAHGRSHTHSDCECVVHWDDGRTTDTFGLPSVPRILRQILGCRGLEEFFVSLESALHQGLLSRAGVAWLKANTNAAAREAIVFARSDAESGLESLLRWRLRRHGLRIRSQVTIVSVGVVDFLIGDRLVVEVDGRQNHDGESERHKDLQRDANAAAWGYVTLRFNYAMVVHDWETVELAILAHVDRGLHLR